MAIFILWLFLIQRGGFLHSADAQGLNDRRFWFGCYKCKRTTIPALRPVGGRLPPLHCVIPLRPLFLQYLRLPRGPHQSGLCPASFPRGEAFVPCIGQYLSPAQIVIATWRATRLPPLRHRPADYHLIDTAQGIETCDGQKPTTFVPQIIVNCPLSIVNFQNAPPGVRRSEGRPGCRGRG